MSTQGKLSIDAEALLACMRELSYTWRQTRISLMARELAAHLDETLDRYERGEFAKIATKANLQKLRKFYKDMREAVDETSAQAEGAVAAER
jgi:hypothetical protein